jgi:glycosyltransferase involved in cell wall biosynthesis
MNPLVSVIVPAFNAAHLIGRTLQSVSAQTYPRLEILVVDDGSRDETSERVLEAAAKDPRIHLLRQENRGVAAARNTGIEASRGDFVAPIDADDIWFPQKLEKQTAVFRSSPPTVGLVYAGSAPIFGDRWPPRLSMPKPLEGAVYLPLLRGNFLSNASTPLIRRECFERVGRYDPSYRDQDAQGCEDWDLYLRIAEQYAFRAVTECLVGYHQSVDTMSADWHRMHKSYRILMARVKASHPAIPHHVFRWSNAGFLLYLATKVSRAQRYGEAVKFLGHALSQDPWLMLDRRWSRLLIKSLRGSVRLREASTIAPSVQHPAVMQTAHPHQLATVRGHGGGIIWTRVTRRRTVHLLDLQHALGLDLRSTPTTAL